MPNLVVLCLTVYAKEEENPQNWGPLGPHRLGMEGVRAGHLKQSPLHMCYYAQFGRSSFKSAVMDIKEPAKLGSTGDPHFGTELWLTP